MTEAEASPGRPPESPPDRTWAFWLGLLVSVAVGSFMSALAYAQRLPAFVENVPQLDKAFHFAISGVVAFFLDRVLQRRSLRVGALAVPLSSVVFLVPAAIEEYLQRYSDYRTSSLLDFTSDLTGVVIFTWFSRRLGR